LRSKTSVRVEVFEYPPGAANPQTSWEELTEAGTEGPLPNRKDCDARPIPNADSQKELRTSAAEIASRSFEEGKELGIREEREKAAGEYRALLQDVDRKRIEETAHLADHVAEDRARFIHEVELEVVRLALAIAARILRREAQMDPLFLIGAVRVALGQLAATIEVRLRIPASESELWIETIKHIPNLKVRPAVIPDGGMQIGDCVIETEMGSVDIGLRSQLHQIEMALVGGVSAAEGDAETFPRPREGEVGA
jgi:flagellar biosynthesis/type III secretory pathway protein FliH